MGISHNSFSQDINASDCKTGDVVFIKKSLPPSSQVNEKAKFNCAGIIFVEKGKSMVYYADEPLKKCELNDFIKLSENSKYNIKRMVEANLLTEEAISTMKIFVNAKLGSAYDTKEELTSENFYNAEFIWKIYKNYLGVYVCEPKEVTASGSSSKNYSNGGGNSLANKYVSVNDIYKSEFFE